MNLNLTARLLTITNRLGQNIPKIDLEARLQRYNQNRPASALERCVFNIVDFGYLLPSMGFHFIFTDAFRDRVYYLYEHPDHDDSGCLYPRIKWRHPYTTKWIIYLFPKVRRIWHRCLRLSRDLKALVPTFKSSPSVFGVSPKLAVVIHGAGEWAEDLKIPNGFIRIFYAPSFEHGRYHADSEFEPMLAIDLAVTRAGVDLDPLYNKWGLESVAFIVNNDFRPIFKPVNSRVLSPAAAYDLSKEFTRPVRVFEPQVSKYTINKRKLQYPLFVFGFFFISLLGLMCEEPTDRIYMCSLYGRRYADIYECISRWSNGPRSVIKIIFCLLFHFLHQTVLFLISCIVLSAQAVVRAIGWVLMVAIAASDWSFRRSVAVLESVSLHTLDALGLVFSLQWKTWAIAIPAFWILYVELHQMVVA